MPIDEEKRVDDDATLASADLTVAGFTATFEHVVEGEVVGFSILRGKRANHISVARASPSSSSSGPRAGPRRSSATRRCIALRTPSPLVRSSSSRIDVSDGVDASLVAS